LVAHVRQVDTHHRAEGDVFEQVAVVAEGVAVQDVEVLPIGTAMLVQVAVGQRDHEDLVQRIGHAPAQLVGRGGGAAPEALGQPGGGVARATGPPGIALVELGLDVVGELGLVGNGDLVVDPAHVRLAHQGGHISLGGAERGLLQQAHRLGAAGAQVGIGYRERRWPGQAQGTCPGHFALAGDDILAVECAGAAAAVVGNGGGARQHELAAVTEPCETVRLRSSPLMTASLVKTTSMRVPAARLGTAKRKSARAVLRTSTLPRTMPSTRTSITGPTPAASEPLARTVSVAEGAASAGGAGLVAAATGEATALPWAPAVPTHASRAPARASSGHAKRACGPWLDGVCGLVRAITRCTLASRMGVAPHSSTSLGIANHSRRGDTAEMELQFVHHGAVEGVTGSCHQLRLPDGRSVLIDCGLFQGAETSREGAGAGSPEIDFSLDGVQALVLTHVHIDHCGRIPYLLAAGFKGPIVCSEASAELLPMVLEDALQVGVTRDGR
jgi:hypothetical protein